MKRLCPVIFFLTAFSHADAQEIERKIIIEGGHFYCTTVDENFQIATLHKGSVTEPFKSARKYALPAGRNYNVPVIPFSWDLKDGNIYAINFLDHPLNDRNEALKRFEAASLKEWSDEVTLLDMMMESVERNTFAMNDPYLFMLGRSNILENFYFDAVAAGTSSYFLAIANQGELTIWHYDGTTWSHGEVHKMQLAGPFSLFVHKGKCCMVTSSGDVYEVSVSGMAQIKTALSPLQGILIDDRDAGKVMMMRNGSLDDNLPMNEIIEKNSTTIF